jgi:sodium/potassium-transporting ATPase subunit alpha
LIGIPQPIFVLHAVLIGWTTDIYCGIALMFEPAERDLIVHPPPHYTTARLLDFKMLCYSYLFYGNMVALGAFINYFLYVASRGDTRSVPNHVPTHMNSVSLPAGYRIDQLVFAWNFGTDNGAYGRDQIAALETASSIFYLTVVIAQLGQLLSIRREKPYFYDVIMTRTLSTRCPLVVQWQVVCAHVVSIATVVLFLYTPLLNKCCHTMPVSGRWWGLAVGWSVLWFVVAEGRKWLIALNPNSCLGGTV